MLDYHGVNGGGGAGRCWVAFEPHLLIIGPWSLNNNRKTRGLIWFISLCPPSRALGRRIYCFNVFFVKRERAMADNLLDMGPSSAKRPKLNSPALSSSDTPGKMLITPVKSENLPELIRHSTNLDQIRINQIRKNSRVVCFITRSHRCPIRNPLDQVKRSRG